MQIVQAATFGIEISSESKHSKPTPSVQESKKDTSKIESAAISDYVDTRAK